MKNKIIKLFQKINKFFKDIDNKIINDALDDCDYLGAIIANKNK